MHSFDGHELLSRSVDPRTYNTVSPPSFDAVEIILGIDLERVLLEGLKGVDFFALWGDGELIIFRGWFRFECRRRVRVSLHLNNLLLRCI
jgi:hypothetical protein